MMEYITEALAAFVGLVAGAGNAMLPLLQAENR